jgi:DNA modification methylase
VRPEALLDAAETTGRICLAMEIDPRYCDVIVERWQRYIGKTARRVDDNKPVP